MLSMKPSARFAALQLRRLVEERYRSMIEATLNLEVVKKKEGLGGYISS